MSSTFAVPEKQLSTRALISKFLALPRFAIVGVSRNPKDFTRILMRDFLTRGYDVVPVNAAAVETEMERCRAYASVREIHPPVSAVLVMTPSETTEKVVADCADSEVELLWMYRAVGKGAVSEKAITLCRERGIDVIAGECPLMFLPKNGFHAIHGFVRKIMGTYPK